MSEGVRQNEVERYKKLFRDTVEYVIHKKTNFEDRVEEKDEYYVVTEEDRAGCHYVHLVPGSLYHKFRGFQINSPTKEPGQYLLCGRKGGRSIKVACFGVNVRDVIEEFKA